MYPKIELLSDFVECYLFTRLAFKTDLICPFLHYTLNIKKKV